MASSGTLIPDGAFGHWLAGFIDGEGTFLISVNRRKGSHYPIFRLTVRADDAPVIREIQQRTGIGKVYELKRQVRPTRAGEEQITWQVQNKADTERLAHLLTLYPLRSKKARDFVLWKEAVELRAPGYCREQERLAELRRDLMDGRRYAA